METTGLKKGGNGTFRDECAWYEEDCGTCFPQGEDEAVPVCFESYEDAKESVSTMGLAKPVK